MTYANSVPGWQAAETPQVRHIGTDDLKAALRAGYADFVAMPTFAVFLVVIYPVIGLVMARVTMGEDLLPLAYPLCAGFALIGPFAALGLYELSKRREQSSDVGLSQAFDVFRSPSLGSIAALGAVQMIIFLVWIMVAHLIFRSLLGPMHPQSIGDFVHSVVTTPAGWTLMVVGNGVGFVFAALALTLSVVSFPLLLDRPVGAAAAMATSVKAVRANPGPMAVWGLIVAVSLAIACATLFVGLTLVLPILGHATWHLYRRVVVRSNDR